MTEKANPSINRPAEAFKTAGAIAYGGHGGDGFVVDGANPTDISVQDGGITEADLNAFAETSSGSSFDVTIDGGEAFVFGSWLAIDTDTTVTLASSTTGQTVYVGWNKNGSDDIIVGLDGAFSSATGDTDERIPLWTFDTDGSGVTNVVDERRIGYSIEVQGEATFGQNADVTVQYDSGTDEFTLDGADFVVNGLTIMDEGQNYIPQQSLSNDSVTLSAGTSLSGGGSVDLGGSVTINHGDTSSQGNVAAAAGAAITDLDLNAQGHVTNIGTTDFDGRFVNESGDTMSGELDMNNNDIHGVVSLFWRDDGSPYNVFAQNRSSATLLRFERDDGVALMDIDYSDGGVGNVVTHGDLDVNGQTINLPKVSSDPTSGVGDMWYRTDLD